LTKFSFDPTHNIQKAKTARDLLQSRAVSFCLFQKDTKMVELKKDLCYITL